MKGRYTWIQVITGLLQLATGAVIIAVEAEIIHMEEPNTPGAFSLLHQEVAVKGLCQLVGGIVVCVQLRKTTTFTVILALIMSSMNCLTLSFLIWQCGYGISSVSKLCSRYPESCAPGSSMAYSRSLLQTQESMFVIGTFSCLVSLILLAQYIKNTVTDLELRLVTQQAQLDEHSQKYNDVVVFDQ